MLVVRERACTDTCIMPAVRRREDTKKGRGLEIVYGEGGEMGDNELEDGEAYSGEEDSATIDPDISLSYIVRPPTDSMCSPGVH